MRGGFEGRAWQWCRPEARTAAVPRSPVAVYWQNRKRECSLPNAASPGYASLKRVEPRQLHSR